MIAVGEYFDLQGNDAQNRAMGAVAGLSPSACNGAAQPPGCATARDAWSTQDADANRTRAFIGMGAIAVLGGAALFFWPGSSSAKTALLPLAVPHGGGLHVVGEF